MKISSGLVIVMLDLFLINTQIIQKPWAQMKSMYNFPQITQSSANQITNNALNLMQAYVNLDVQVKIYKVDPLNSVIKIAQSSQTLNTAQLHSQLMKTFLNLRDLQ